MSCLTHSGDAVSEAYIFNGYRRTAYFRYIDIDTDITLDAEPGGQYRIKAVEPNLAVPPPDGMWMAAPEVAVKAKRETAVSVKPVQPDGTSE